MALINRMNHFLSLHGYAKSISKKLIIAFRKRGDQVEKLKKHILESPFRVIVCGDFNDSPVSYTYYKFSSIMQRFE